MDQILSQNLKKFRISKNLTQEQAAEMLNVSAQTVSRWECATTLPEVTKLPEIARLYGVTIDDLFQDNATAYKNYAQRLASVYESTRSSEDFICAEREFKSLMDRGNYTLDDMRIFGIIYQFMMTSCKEEALYWFDRVLREGAQVAPDVCHRTRLQKMKLFAQNGQADEAVAEQLEAAQHDPRSAEQRSLLVSAYVYADRYEEARQCVEDALTEFPEAWELYVHAGDICIHLEQYQKALSYADQALRLRPTWVEAKYIKALCYEKTGESQKASDMYRKIASDLRLDGFEVEATAEIQRAKYVLKQQMA